VDGTTHSDRDEVITCGDDESGAGDHHQVSPYLRDGEAVGKALGRFVDAEEAVRDLEADLELVLERVGRLERKYRQQMETAGGVRPTAPGVAGAKGDGALRLKEKEKIGRVHYAVSGVNCTQRI
jgi:hypothetical protein